MRPTPNVVNVISSHRIKLTETKIKLQDKYALTENTAVRLRQKKLSALEL